MPAARGRAPVIGLTADTGSTSRESGAPQDLFVLRKAYFDAVMRAGGLPMLIPPTAEPRKAIEYLALIDGLIVTGGHFDIAPELYGETPQHRIDEVKPERTLMEIALIRKAVKAGMPTLGICGGMQAINVAAGGSLYQDIPAQVPNHIPHEQSPLPTEEPSHEVAVGAGTLFHRITGAASLMVNSTHHQAVKKIGKGLVACATAVDGLVEAIEGKTGPFLLGVQWHPERLGAKDQASVKLFRRFVSECGKFGKSRKQQVKPKRGR